MIIGKRVRLRGIERDDLPRFVAWLNDPEVLKGLMLYVPMSLPQEQGWFENMLKQPLVEQPMVIEVQAPEGWQPVGNIGFHHVDWHNQSAEVGIFIGEKRLWSQGYGRDAMSLILNYGFNTVNLHRIFLRVYEDNPRAIRSYERAGFAHEGRLREAQFHDGKYVDVLMMGALRDEWNQQVAKVE